MGKIISKNTSSTSKSSTDNTKSPKTTKKNSLRLPKIRKLHFRPGYIIGAVILSILAIFFLRVAIWEHGYFSRMEGSERHTTESSQATGDDGEHIDDHEPNSTEVAEYIVAPDKPRYLSIPSLGINNSRIVEIGLKSNGELSTPYNIYDVGWYTKSALPGAKGVSIIDAHGGAQGSGIFRSLPRIHQGATINIEMGDGRMYTYTVVDLATKAIGDEANDYMNKSAFSSPTPGKSSLTLITCTGDYWLSSRTYSHRLFVRAILQE